jgi:hypothetical protein
MKALFLAFRVYRYLAVVSLSLGLEACATDTTTFLNYGNPPSNAPLPPREQLMAAPAVSDGLAINYANSVEIIMRCKATQSRITREVSATAQVGLAAFGGVGAAYNWSKTTLTVLGLASAAIPQLQGIFDAKGRAEAYNQAAEMIQDGVLEYYAHNSAPSPAEFTPNGLTLVKRVGSAINLVNDTINGHLPSQADMKRATERMTSGEGNEPQNPNDSPVNERAQTAAVSTRTFTRRHVRETTVPPKFQPVRPEDVVAAASQINETINKKAVSLHQLNRFCRDADLPPPVPTTGTDEEKLVAAKEDVIMQVLGITEPQRIQKAAAAAKAIFGPQNP